MLRPTFRRLVLQGERRFSFAGESPMSSTGGLPFYGNIYSGRVDSQNYVPPRQGGGTGLIDGNRTKSLWDNPLIQAKMRQCPYFALCDQVLYHNMDPSYLDPGVLTPQEHQLLLLFSRSYYEKWKAIHRRPATAVPRIRIKYGASTLLDELLSLVDCPTEVREVLKLEYQLDDASLIAMDPSCWTTAYLDPHNMDHFSGRVLDFAEMSLEVQKKFFTALDQMRRLKIIRRDVSPSAAEQRRREAFGENPTSYADLRKDNEGRRQGGVGGSSLSYLEGGEEMVVPFYYGVTLFDLYKYLQLTPYSGQLKVYDFVDLDGTPKVITLKDEDTYFDFLVALFYRANLRLATLSSIADNQDNTCRYTITVEPFTAEEKRMGSWL